MKKNWRDYLLVLTYAGFILFVIFICHLLYQNYDRTRAPSTRTVVDWSHETKRPQRSQKSFEEGRDVLELNSIADRKLNGYHWVDKKRGLVGVPIQRAMDDFVKEQAR